MVNEKIKTQVENLCQEMAQFIFDEVNFTDFALNDGGF